MCINRFGHCRLEIFNNFCDVLTLKAKITVVGLDNTEN